MTLDEISFGISIGDRYDAISYSGPRVAVFSDDELREIEGGYNFRQDIDSLVPVLATKSTGYSYVPVSLLEKAAVAIDNALAKSGRVLVHCVAGMERSPLTVVYWLKTRKGFTWDEAYRHVKDRHFDTIDSTDWIRKPERKALGATYVPTCFD